MFGCEIPKKPDSRLKNAGMAPKTNVAHTAPKTNVAHMTSRVVWAAPAKMQLRGSSPEKAVAQFRWVRFASPILHPFGCVALHPSYILMPFCGSFCLQKHVEFFKLLAAAL